LEEMRDKVTTAIMDEVRDYTGEFPTLRHEAQLESIIRNLVFYAMLKMRRIAVAEI
jgi:hypothetical protein